MPGPWQYLHGEYYPQENDSDPAFTFPGYQTQPITYDPAAPYFAGADHVGSDIAERDGMSWATFWRLSFNCNIPFLTDSSTWPALSRVPVELPGTQPQIGQGNFSSTGGSSPWFQSDGTTRSGSQWRTLVRIL